MKIYNKITFEWKDGEYVKTAEESYDYDGPVAQCKGGGGGGDQRYENLDKLYGIQADQAAGLWDIAKDTVFPAYTELLGEAKGYGSQANQNFAADTAGRDADAATASAQLNITDNLASMGVNPGDARYANALRGIQIQGAGQKAAGMTGAREKQRNVGFARLQDATSLGMGTPTQATQAASAASQSASAAGQLQNQSDANQQAGIGNAIRGGFNLYNAASNGFADGGQVLKLKGGGYVQRLAGGGIVGGMRGIAPAPPPMMNRPITSPVAEAMNGAVSVASAAGGGSATAGFGKGIASAGEMFGSQGMTDLGVGMQNPAFSIKDAATQVVDAAMGNTAAPASTAGMDALASTVAEESGSVLAEQAGAAAAEAAAADAAAAAAAETGATVGAEALAGSALGTVGTAIGTAVPIIGAGLAAYTLGNSMGWWADGGQVTPGAAGQTGEVDGPGGPKDDLIPAMLSDGEFVMPVGAVKKFGLDKLEKMRADGLEFEKKLGIGRGR